MFLFSGKPFVVGNQDWFVAFLVDFFFLLYSVNELKETVFLM